MPARFDQDDRVSEARGLDGGDNSGRCSAIDDDVVDGFVRVREQLRLKRQGRVQDKRQENQEWKSDSGLVLKLHS